jgi:coenzyme F420-reducing hydrogenase gamma subunit
MPDNAPFAPLATPAPAGNSVVPPVTAMALGRKLRVGWFSFSCCEDRTIVFTEMLNDYYDAWSKIIEFRAARVLMKKYDLTDLDVAFVEGAIASEKHEKELREIRAATKKLVAVGSCAINGKPSAQRNEFSPELQREIEALLERFDHLPKVLRVQDLVKVDYEVPGCPMTEQVFLKTLGTILSDFGLKTA